MTTHKRDDLLVFVGILFGAISLYFQVEDGAKPGWQSFATALWLYFAYAAYKNDLKVLVSVVRFLWGVTSIGVVAAFVVDFEEYYFLGYGSRSDFLIIVGVNAICYFLIALRLANNLGTNATELVLKGLKSTNSPS